MFLLSFHTFFFVSLKKACKCSQFSLSQLGLSRITQKSHISNKILWIRGEIAPREQCLPFSTYFQHIFLVKGVKLHIFMKFGCSICIFLNLFLKSDMSKYGYLEVFQRVPLTLRLRELIV